MAHRTCSIQGCTAKYSARGLCNTHYMRLRRSGVELVRPSPLERYAAPSGYINLLAPGHPLARGRRYILEHRAVLYAVVGPGPQKCFWCGTTIDWQDPSAGRRVCVDHLDGSRDNNEPANLVPSCSPCNRGRGGHCSAARNAIFIAARMILNRYSDEFHKEHAGIAERLNVLEIHASDKQRAEAIRSAAMLEFDQIRES